jgi:16S rRNA (guanine966-N2)-methyltransferase
MRVIAGELRGRTIRPPKARDFRPTTDRVKESLFNILAHRMPLRDTRVCDLFAGSGSLGIEALSRGAASATFVENGRDALEIVRRNIADLGLSASGRIAAVPVERFLATTEERFDLILADPPYAYAAHASLMETVSTRRVLRAGGFLVMEHSGHTTLPVPAQWVLVTTRDFGTTAITLLQGNPENPERPA